MLLIFENIVLFFLRNLVGEFGGGLWFFQFKREHYIFACKGLLLHAHLQLLNVFAIKLHICKHVIDVVITTNAYCVETSLLLVKIQ